MFFFVLFNLNPVSYPAFGRQFKGLCYVVFTILMLKIAVLFLRSKALAALPKPLIRRPRCSDHLQDLGSSLSAVTFFILFPASAGAGVIPTDFFSFTMNRRRLG